MSSRPWGYRRGPLEIVPMKMDSASAAITAGDFVDAGTAGYVQKADAGDLPVGVALDSHAAVTADGDATIRVSVHPDAVYEYPPDAGTVTQGLVNTTMDIGGAQTINIDASADDIITVVEVDTTRNTLLVKLTPTFAGVA